MFLNLSFKITTNFANVARTTVNLYTKKDFKSSGTGPLYKK